MIESKYLHHDVLTQSGMECFTALSGLGGLQMSFFVT